jgi:hypothetical protein
MVRGISYMFVTGPSVVKTVTHEDVDFDGLGGADVHGGTSGVAHFVHDTEADTLAGVRRLLPAGRRARDTAASADWLVGEDGSGLVFVYLPDCDNAGHEYGWMSDRYLAAAAELDAAIGVLSQHVDDALLIVVADHGGGGVLATEHHHPHPVNEHIPVVLAGPGVAREHQLEGPVSILDLSATVLWWFGAPIPDCYEGRPLLEAFAPQLVPQESAL